MSDPLRITVDTAQGAMSVLEWPNAHAPLLHFAHANGFNAQTYQGLLSPLQDDFHILAGDARGHGFTALPTPQGLARDWTIFRDDLIALLDRVAPQGAILAGHSMGATASLMAAVERPELVQALVLAEPVLVPQGAPTGENELSLKAARRRDVFASADEAFEAYLGRGAFKTWPQETLRDYLCGGLEPFEGGVRLRCRPSWESEDFRSTPAGVAALARRVRCTVTLIYGAQGTASQGEVALFRQLHPETRVIAEAKASHFLPMEFPALVRAEILRLKNAGRDARAAPPA
ncbi:MAG: alpha/beta hydrolase [Alphaproteobacteria bacterium]|nr:alpha/beta hydrolase [Alphaproteobacteria bacterium]MBV9692664.1 alpha/beta hydrolase [Alphaproteobacteria bacterium]